MTAGPNVIQSAKRRRALALGHWNGALWASGNALTSGFLVSYLAQELGAQGRQLALLLAVPSLAGVLRLAAPAVIGLCGGTKRAAVGLSAASYTLIQALPLVALGRGHYTDQQLLAALVVLISVHQLLEYLASVAIFTWLDKWIPPRVRSRYFARRQAWQLGVQIPLAIGGALFADYWSALFPRESPDRLIGFAIPNAVGAVLLLASVLPLWLMPAAQNGKPRRPLRSAPAAVPASPSLNVRGALADGRFRRLLAFRVWLSISNGLTQTVQYSYPKNVLGLGSSDLTTMKIGMQCGQLALARPVGRWADRLGNRPVIGLAQICVAAGLLFYLLASPAGRAAGWVLAGAWLCWSAYVAHNVCLPSLVLKLAPPAGKPAYFALHEGLASACHAAATLAGGFLFDWLVQQRGGGGWLTSMAPYTAMFLLGLAMRVLAVPLIYLVEEPGARRLTEIARRS